MSSHHDSEEMRTQVQSLALLSGLRIQCCPQLWCRLQIQLGSCVAVAVVEACNYSSDWTPSLETSICHGCGPKRQKGKKKKKEEKKRKQDHMSKHSPQQ